MLSESDNEESGSAVAVLVRLFTLRYLLDVTLILLRKLVDDLLPEELAVVACYLLTELSDDSPVLTGLLLVPVLLSETSSHEKSHREILGELLISRLVAQWFHIPIL